MSQMKKNYSPIPAFSPDCNWKHRNYFGQRHTWQWRLASICRSLLEVKHFKHRSWSQIIITI